MGLHGTRCTLGLGFFFFGLNSEFSHACAHIWRIVCPSLNAMCNACAHMGNCVKIMHEHMCVVSCLRVCTSQCVWLCARTHNKESVSVPLMCRRLLKPKGMQGQLAPLCSQGMFRVAGAVFKPAVPEPWSWHLEVISLTNRQSHTISVCAHWYICSETFETDLSIFLLQQFPF